MSFLARNTDFDSDNHPHVEGDFAKRYLYTYMKMDNDIIYCYGIDKTYFYFDNLQTQTNFIYKKGDPDLNITPYLPNIGYYNIKGSPFFLYKNPQRQYKRSMCDSVYTIDYTPPRNATKEQIKNYWDTLVLETCNPVYAHLDEIMKELFGYVALNSKFAVKEQTLLYRKYPIGTLNFEKRILTVSQPTLRQEISDLFKYTGVQTWMLR